MHKSAPPLQPKRKQQTYKSMMDTTIDNIIWKYANYRRNYRHTFLDVNLELLNFVYEQKVEKKDNDITKALAKYKYVSGILSKEEEEVLLANYPEVVETFCHANENGMTEYAEALQPYEITQYAAGLLHLDDGAKVYNPFAGYASYAIAAPHYRFTGDEINRTTWAILKLRLLVKGIEADYSLQDSYLRSAFLSAGYFNGAIATPPFGMKGHSEIETAEQILKKLAPEGRVVFVSLLGPLFRGGKEEKIRKNLVDNGFVESIIELPDNLFYGTSISCAIIVLSNKYNECIKMVDASGAYKEQDGKRGRKIFDEGLLKEQIEEVSRNVSNEEVASMGYKLLPKQYLLKLDEDVESCLITDICNFQSAIKVDSEVKERVGGFISIKGLSTKFPTSSLRKGPARFKNDLEKGFVIEQPTIFVLRTLPTTSALSIGYADENTGLPFLCGSDYHFALTVKSPNITFQYLMLQLQSEYVWKQVSSFAMGASGMARMSLDDFKSLRIPMVSLPEQEKLVLKAVEGTLSDVEKKRTKEAEQYRKGVHTRKHALEQTVSSLSSRWNKLVNYLTSPKKDPEEGKALKAILSYVIPGVNRLSVAEQIDTIDNLIKLAAQQVENLAEVKVNVKSIDTFNPTQLIMDYLRRYPSNLYLPVPEFTDMEGKNDTITFPKSVLEQIFNNIIANAVEYGFHNTETPGNKIRFRCYKEDSNVIIEIANNGEPLKEGVEADTIFTANFSTLLNTRGHSGTGATEVRSLMEQFGGSVEAYSTPDKEYKFTYKLVFNESN